VLVRILRDIEVGEVVQALKETEPQDIAIAALFVAFGYFTLTFYDLFALRTIGRPDVPYRVAALGGFTSYAIGHNVGASVVTGGAVRYRIYSAWGLDAIAVAKVCFIAGLTFWLGNATVLGLGIAYAPQAATAMDQLPPARERGARRHWRFRRRHAGRPMAVRQGRSPRRALVVPADLLCGPVCALAAHSGYSRAFAGDARAATTRADALKAFGVGVACAV